MSDFENRMGTLLRDAVPEPPAGIDPTGVVRLARRRRTTTLAGAAGAVAAAALAVVLVVVLAGRPARTTAPPARQPMLQLGGLTITYPATWTEQPGAAFVDPAVKAGAALGAPIAVANGVVQTACRSAKAGGVAPCISDFARPDSRSVFVNAQLVHLTDTSRLKAFLTAKVAGRSARVFQEIDVTTTQCPTSSQTSVRAEVDLGDNRFAMLDGCLGGSPTALKAFQRLLDSARFTP